MRKFKEFVLLRENAEEMWDAVSRAGMRLNAHTLSVLADAIQESEENQELVEPLRWMAANEVFPLPLDNNTVTWSSSDFVAPHGLVPYQYKRRTGYYNPWVIGHEAIGWISVHGKPQRMYSGKISNVYFKDIKSAIMTMIEYIIAHGTQGILPKPFTYETVPFSYDLWNNMSQVVKFVEKGEDFVVKNINSVERDLHELTFMLNDIKKIPDKPQNIGAMPPQNMKTLFVNFRNALNILNPHCSGDMCYDIKTLAKKIDNLLK